MKNKNKAYTLVELVAAIALLIVLSVLSFVSYRAYVKKAIGMEGRALLYDVHAAEQVRRARFGSYLTTAYTKYNANLGVDTRGNKYFTGFKISTSNASTFTVTTSGYEGRSMWLTADLTRINTMVDQYSNSN